ncbi:hypothetical protein XELAEV_18042093mg [Xenopus laevis]|uniref:Protein ATP1B4 n=1 Tax=Xenopus laevis TaxID=8355 RepID=A0A974C3I1_XENLA|nr:hypothetical protein XELAEV_18042093mg [Xenopus laevis]
MVSYASHALCITSNATTLHRMGTLMTEMVLMGKLDMIILVLYLPDVQVHSFQQQGDQCGTTYPREEGAASGRNRYIFALQTGDVNPQDAVHPNANLTAWAQAAPPLPSVSTDQRVTIAPRLRPLVHALRVLTKPASAAAFLCIVQQLVLKRPETKYNDETQQAKNLACTPGKYFLQPGEDYEERIACQFRSSLLKNCSGIEDPTFGFEQGKPCILLKMNRIVGYQAGSGIPIYVTCEVLKADMSYLGSVNFYPSDKFDLMYYPYYGKLTHVNYTSPVIAMHFTEVLRDRDVNIQCKINGEDIISDHEKDRFLGRVVFTLHIG